MPATLDYPLRSDSINWVYAPELECNMNNRQMYCLRGKVLGGSSCINGMAYVRWHANDYARWAQSFAVCRWSYFDCLPYFTKVGRLNIAGDIYRGNDGPHKVMASNMNNPLYQAWLKAGREFFRCG
jgi:choline dehydrogenase